MGRNAPQGLRPPVLRRTSDRDRRPYQVRPVGILPAIPTLGMQSQPFSLAYKSWLDRAVPTRKPILSRMCRQRITKFTV
jgi:hypothetical protein